MKKILFCLVLLVSSIGSAQAHGYYRNGWVGPAILGGVIGYEMARPRYYEQPVVVVQQPPVYVQQAPAVPYGYHYTQILDANCNCYRTVLVPN